MGSRERLWEIFGPAWAWPKETMTYEEDRIDLLRHEKEIAAHQSFNYALLDEEETAILGCVYIDPPERTGSDGEVSWWVVDDLVGGEVERALDELVPQWIAADWPFQQPRYLGRDITWRTGSRCRAPRDTSEAVQRIISSSGSRRPSSLPVRGGWAAKHLFG